MDTIVTPVTVITLDSTRIVHSIKADLVARYFPPVVRLVQYDMSLPVIAVSLMHNGQTYTLPSGAAANIRVHKPDATYVYNPALGCDSTRNIVYFEVTQAMAAANGDGLAIVEIVVNGDIAGTSLITLHFEENPVPEDAIESSDEWETIYELGERIIASTVTPVSTAAGMTDHNVVYLYTGTESGWNQGHMYYYNGTTWVDAGIAVTDTTLSVAGLAADAKKTGDEIADLKDGLGQLLFDDSHTYSSTGNWRTVSVAGKTNIVIKLNNRTGATVEVAMLVGSWTVVTTIYDDKYHLISVPSNVSDVIILTYRGSGAFTLHCEIWDASDVNITREVATFDGLSELIIKSNSVVVNASTYSTLLPDANDITDNSVYRLDFSFGSTSIPTHLPITSWINRNMGTLYTFVTKIGTHSAGDYQIFITSENVWTRIYTNSWQSWITFGQLSKYPESIQTVVNASTYSTILPSANDVTDNSIYRLNFAKDSTAFPSGLPFAKWEGERTATLMTFVTNVGLHSAADTQMLITSENVWVRNYLASAWSDWHCITSGKEYTVDINGSGDYTSLYACIVEAIKHKNSVVKVKKGTYNVINELKALKGDNYFTNFNYSTDAIYLDNGIRIIGESGVFITALFDSPVNNVSNYFSPFDLRFDCTLENLEIRAKNCRYCIHDDQWDRTTPYTHIFKNLKLVCDNAENTLWTRRLAFGGGLGTCGHIEFHNCYFESTGLDGTAYSGYGSMGYHNSPAQGESDIIVDGCYFAGDSTFRITYMGTYTNMTTAFVTGCSFGRAMEIANERVEDSTVNVEIIDCNNVIRS